MKKNVVVVAVLLIAVLLACVGCSSEPKLQGTFVNEEAGTLVFDGNGNVTMSTQGAIRINLNGTYTVFILYYINGVENADQDTKYAMEENDVTEYDGGALIGYIFGEITDRGNKYYQRDSVDFFVDVTALYDENGKLVSGATERNDWQFNFNLNRTKNVGKLISDPEQAKIFTYKGLEITINEIRENEFGTSVMVSVGEEYGERNDLIEDIDIVITDQNGKEIKKIAEHEEVFSVTPFDVYGRCFDKYIVLDADESVTDYNIKFVSRQDNPREF